MYQECGFTLIELLIVVLIIGILSAVALPQYQAAVDKARFGKYIPLGTSIKRAQEAYYLANGNYSPNLTDLDIAVPASCTLRFGGGGQNEAVCEADGIYINNAAGGYVSSGSLHLAICPGALDSWHSCANNAGGIAGLVFYFDNHPQKPGQTVCGPLGGSARGKRLCKALGF